MEIIMTFAGVLSVLIFAVMEAVNRTGLIPKKYVAIASGVIGAIIGAAVVLVPEIGTSISVPGGIIAGLMAGLSSSGIHEAVKRPIKNDMEDTQ